MESELAEEIIDRLIGVSVNFSQNEGTIMVNPNLYVTFTTSIGIKMNGNSYFKIGFNPLNWLPNFSFGIFDISPKAKELGMKLTGLINEGEVCVNCSFNSLKIKVKVIESSGKYNYCSESVIIEIIFPERRNYQRNQSYEENQDYINVKKAFGISALAVGAIILTKLIKGGIGAVMAGPVGAAIGFVA